MANFIDAGASLGASLLNMGFARHQNKDQARRAQAMAQQQRNYELAMFNLENRYNSPANQLKLLQDAGVNPANADTGFQVGSAGAGSMGENPSPFPYTIGNPYAEALQTESMSEQVKAQKLANREKERELGAKEKRLPYPEAVVEFLDKPNVTFDENGGLIVDVDVAPNYNAWEEQRADFRNNMKRNQIAYEKELKELQTFLHQMDALKEMPAQQLAALIEDIRSKQLNNDILKNEKDVSDLKTAFFKKYGITGDEGNWFSALLKAILYNPNSLSNVIDALQKFGDVTINSIASKLGSSGNNPLLYFFHQMKSNNGATSW